MVTWTKEILIKTQVLDRTYVLAQIPICVTSFSIFLPLVQVNWDKVPQKRQINPIPSG